MSKQQIPYSNWKFYPLPYLNFINGGIIYIEIPIIKFFYRVYSNFIDKNYYLRLYSKRYEKEPDKKILRRLGKEWAAISTIVDDTLKGILIRMFVEQKDPNPFTLKKYIEDHSMMFRRLKYISKFTFKSNIVVSSSYNLTPLKALQLQVLCKEKVFKYDYISTLNKTLSNSLVGSKYYLDDGPNKAMMQKVCLKYDFSYDGDYWEKLKYDYRKP